PGSRLRGAGDRAWFRAHGYAGLRPRLGDRAGRGGLQCRRLHNRQRVSVRLQAGAVDQDRKQLGAVPQPGARHGRERRPGAGGRRPRCSRRRDLRERPGGRLGQADEERARGGWGGGVQPVDPRRSPLTAAGHARPACQDRRMTSVHTDVVGSLLRPVDLIEARERLVAGTIQPAQFKAIEDRAVDAAIRLQEDSGLDVATDGEMRRLSFQSPLVDAVEGFGDVDLDAFLWGDWHSEALGDRTIERPERLGVVSKVRPRRQPSAEEFTYLRARTTRIPKITLTSPG